MCSFGRGLGFRFAYGKFVDSALTILKDNNCFKGMCLLCVMYKSRYTVRRRSLKDGSIENECGLVVKNNFSEQTDPSERGVVRERMEQIKSRIKPSDTMVRRKFQIYPVGLTAILRASCKNHILEEDNFPVPEMIDRYVLGGLIDHVQSQTKRY